MVQIMVDHMQLTYDFHLFFALDACTLSQLPYIHTYATSFHTAGYTTESHNIAAKLH